MAVVWPERHGSGGATARSGGAATAKDGTALRPSPEQMGGRTRFTRVEGTLRHDPELLGSPEVS